MGIDRHRHSQPGYHDFPLFVFVAGELFAIDKGEMVDPLMVEVYCYPSWIKDNDVIMQVIIFFCHILVMSSLYERG